MKVFVKFYSYKRVSLLDFVSIFDIKTNETNTKRI